MRSLYIITWTYFFLQDLKYLDMMQLRSVLILFAQQMTIKLLPPHSILITYSFYKELLYFFPFVRCKKIVVFVNCKSVFLTFAGITKIFQIQRVRKKILRKMKTILSTIVVSMFCNHFHVVESLSVQGSSNEFPMIQPDLSSFKSRFLKFT